MVGFGVYHQAVGQMAARMSSVPVVVVVAVMVVDTPPVGGPDHVGKHPMPQRQWRGWGSYKTRLYLDIDQPRTNY